MQSFLKCWFHGACYGNKLIFPSDADNRIISVDMETGQIDFGAELHHAYKDRQMTPFGYAGAIRIASKKILFVPRNSENLLTFDMKTGEQAITELELPDTMGEDPLYWENLMYQNKLSLFPLYADHILQLDMDTMQAEKREGMIREIDLYIGKHRKPYFAAKAMYDKNQVLLAGWSENYVVRADLTLSNWHIEALENEGDEKGFRDIMVCGNYIYAVNHRFHVLQYERDNFEYVKQVKVMKECSMVKTTEDGLCFVPAFEEDFVVCNAEGNSISRIPYPEDYTFLAEGEKVKANHLLAETDNYYLIARTYGNTIVKIDKKTGKVFYVPLRYGESVISYAYSQHKIFMEGKRIPNGNGLNICADFREFIANVGSQGRNCNEVTSNGKTIYGNLKRSL